MGGLPKLPALGFSGSGKHHIGFTQLNLLHARPDAVRARGAGRGNAVGHALNLEGSGKHRRHRADWMDEWVKQAHTRKEVRRTRQHVETILYFFLYPFASSLFLFPWLQAPLPAHGFGDAVRSHPLHFVVAVGVEFAPLFGGARQTVVNGLRHVVDRSATLY